LLTNFSAIVQVFLSAFDSIFLVLSIIESIEKAFIVKLAPFHTLAVVHFFYPLRNINLCCCIYITVGLAMERYLAVSKPIEYHNAVNLSGSKWPRIMAYVSAVLFFSVVVNITKFFELTVHRKNSSTDPVKILILKKFFF
jgi:hypothetical protein